MAGPGIAHGGTLAGAARCFPEAPRPFIDLSTGINPYSYPLPELSPECFARLPEPEDVARLEAIAARAYGVAAPEIVVAAPGTQILISLLPHLLPRGEHVAVLSPTYGEHARSWANAGYSVAEIDRLDAAVDADRVVLCNPNNPDGRRFKQAELRPLADRLARRGGILLVDEAFADFEAPGLSMAPGLPHPGIVVLRSFGKSYGLAGIRLGFLLAAPSIASLVRRALGPWAVSGPALSAGILALADDDWRQDGMVRLAIDAARLDALLIGAGFALVGGTSLFRLYEGEGAPAISDHLARRGILIRAFAGHPGWLRFGIPGSPLDWARLEGALR